MSLTIWLSLLASCNNFSKWKLTLSSQNLYHPKFLSQLESKWPMPLLLALLTYLVTLYFYFEKYQLHEDLLVTQFFSLVRDMWWHNFLSPSSLSMLGHEPPFLVWWCLLLLLHPEPPSQFSPWHDGYNAALTYHAMSNKSFLFLLLINIFHLHILFPFLQLLHLFLLCWWRRKNHFHILWSKHLPMILSRRKGRFHILWRKHLLISYKKSSCAPLVCHVGPGHLSSSNLFGLLISLHLNTTRRSSLFLGHWWRNLRIAKYVIRINISQDMLRRLRWWSIIILIWE